MGEIMNQEIEQEKTVVGLGFFDGLHIGHMSLIKRVYEYAQKHWICSIVYTFDVHPNNVLQKTHFSKLLMSNAQKERIIAEEGIDQVIFDRFDEALASMSPKDFVEEVLVKRLKVGHIVVGFNYNFGANGTGDINCLIALGAEFGFTVEVIPPVYSDGELVSSTLIRKLLEEGDMRKVSKLFGRPFELSGHVTSGRQLGSKMNYPTANIFPEYNLITPLLGVYASLVKLESFEQGGEEITFKAVTNVGTNPTVSSEDSVRVETHIFDFNEGIYGKLITVQFIEMIRPEQKFADIETLFAQISKDSEKARRILDVK